MQELFQVVGLGTYKAGPALYVRIIIKYVIQHVCFDSPRPICGFSDKGSSERDQLSAPEMLKASATVL